MNLVVNREEMFHVSDSYRDFWNKTVTELEKTIYDEKHNPLWKSRTIWSFNFDCDRPLINLNVDRSEPNAILFSYIKNALDKEINNSWSQRALSLFSVLNSSGRPYTSAEMAYYLYDITCDKILSDYSGVTGIPLRTISELANIGYEKSDFKETKLVFDFAPSQRKCFLSFSEVPFSAKNLRTVRKISAGVGEKRALYICCDTSQKLLCQGYITATKEVSADFPVLVTLHGRREWSFSMYGAELFRVAGRQVKVIEPNFKECQAVKRLKKELEAFDLVKSEKFDWLLEALHEQKHGTSVIFSTFSSKTFYDRLKNLERFGRARALIGFHIVEKEKDEICELTSMARIDGAFVVDLEADQEQLKSNPSRCSIYTGVLLDSPAASKGFIGHGARTNSVLAFVQEAMQTNDSEFKIAALVFSEDGYVLPILGSEALQLRMPECENLS